MSIDQVISMVTMWNSIMTTARAMNMVTIMLGTYMTIRAVIRIFCAYFNKMLINMTSMWVMKMTIVQIINMIVMANRSMAALWPMLVVMMFVMGLVTI
ncbi:TPA: hypothetical protein ACGZ5T_000049 [Klebsiella oxytoca]